MRSRASRAAQVGILCYPSRSALGRSAFAVSGLFRSMVFAVCVRRSHIKKDHMGMGQNLLLYIIIINFSGMKIHLPSFTSYFGLHWQYFGIDTGLTLIRPSLETRDFLTWRGHVWTT